MSSIYNKEFGEGTNKITVPFTSWQVKADSIRKLNNAGKAYVPVPGTAADHPTEAPF